MLVSALLTCKDHNKEYNRLPNFKGILEVKHHIPGRIRMSCPNLKNNKEYMTYSSHIQNDSLIEKNPIEYFPALYNNEILLGISLIKEFKSLKKYILINKNTSNYNSSNNIIVYC